jgi:hypothetical protein
MMIGSFSQIAYVQFTASLAPVALIGLVLTFVLIALFHRGEFASGARLVAEIREPRTHRVLMLRATLAASRGGGGGGHYIPSARRPWLRLRGMPTSERSAVARGRRRGRLLVGALGTASRFSDRPSPVELAGGNLLREDFRP